MAKRKLLTEDEVKGMIHTCEVCGSKFIDTTGLNSLMCPKCIEETVARHKNEQADKSVTSPNSILRNMPVTPFSCPVRIPKKGVEETTKHNDDIMPQMEAFKYATAHLNGDFVKKDYGKLQWSLLPFEELKDVVKVLMRGAEKYSPDNWKKCDNVTRYKDALMRHVIAYVSGEKIDSEFGLSHLAHAVCNCLFLMWFDNHKDAPLELEEDKRND